MPHYSTVMEAQPQTSDMADTSEHCGKHESTTGEQISTPSCQPMPAKDTTNSVLLT